jgi:integrase
MVPRRGYPDGKSGSGWSPSYRKSYLSASKFIYRHFQAEEDLPDHNPAALGDLAEAHSPDGLHALKGRRPKASRRGGDPEGPAPCLLAFYAPSRRKIFTDARWPDIDLDAGTWEVVGKGGKVDVFDLAPPLVREFRTYRRWQLSEAQRNPAIRDALADPETAYVLLTKNGKRTHDEHVAKILRWHAIRNGVAVRRPKGKWDAPGGLTSLVTPHAMRRTWATLALNDDEHPVPLDVVSEVLNHSDISTTRRHYAPTKPDRAKKALMTMRV